MQQKQKSKIVVENNNPKLKKIFKMITQKVIKKSEKIMTIMEKISEESPPNKKSSGSSV